MKGNQYWKHRKQHGRPRKFASPEDLWQAACNYFDWCEKHPLTKVEQSKWHAAQVRIPLERPYSLSGFRLFNHLGTNYLSQLKARLKPEDEEMYFTICRIENVIEDQQLVGAIVGAFNPSIIARSLGLRNKVQVTPSQFEPQPMYVQT